MLARTVKAPLAEITKGCCPLLLIQQAVEVEVQRLQLSDSSAEATFQELGDWSIDSGSEAPATARIQCRPNKWAALLGNTFPARVAEHGLSLHVDRQPYQVQRPRQLPMPEEAAAEVSKQVASHLLKGYVEIVPTESDDHLPLGPNVQHWEQAVPVEVSRDIRLIEDGAELARRLRQTAAHCRAGRSSLDGPRPIQAHLNGPRSVQAQNGPRSVPAHLQHSLDGPGPTNKHMAKQQHQTALLFERREDHPQVFRGARGYVHKVHLDYESQLFVVPKRKQGEWRMCQNLKFWNIDFASRQHFKLEGASALAAMLRPGDWACTGDLSQADHQCGIHPLHRRQLRFRWNGVRYQWRVLPFGLRLAPLYWTKLLRPVIAKARAAGIRCLLYLDDLVVVASSKTQTAKDWAVLAGLLSRELGLLFARAKTNTIPTQVFDALGFVWDCTDRLSPLCRLPVRKVKALARMAGRLARMFQSEPALKKVVSCRLVARYLGLLESVRLACPWIRRRKGALSWCLRRALRHSGWEGAVRSRPQVVQDLLAVQASLSDNCAARLQIPPPSMVVAFGADAAKSLQWGAWATRPALPLHDGRVLPAVDVETFGPFTADECASSINVLEAVGQFQGLAALLPLVLKDVPASVRSEAAVECVCDNTTTLHVNNKQRARVSWLQLMQANQTWDLLPRLGLDPLRWSTTHLAGVLNVRADRLSRRRFDPRAWSLAPWVFRLMQQQLKLHCCMDLFADRSNAQCRRYAAMQGDGAAEFVNAFSRAWTPLVTKRSVLYAHPPYVLIPQVVRRVLEEQMDLVLVTPCWPAQVWWPLLLSLAVRLPVLLPDTPFALLPPGYPSSRTLWPQRWRMVAWHISGDITNSSGFRKPREIASSTRPSTDGRHKRTRGGGNDSSTGRQLTDADILSSIQQGLNHFV